MGNKVQVDGADFKVNLTDIARGIISDTQPCCCGTPELAIQARSCATGDLVDLWYEVGGLVDVSPNNNTDPVVEDVPLGSAEASFVSGKLYFFFGNADAGACYYFDEADQVPFSSMPALAHRMNLPYWPYSWGFEAGFTPTIFLINDDCTSDWGYRPTWPCDFDDDGITDDPPPGVEVIPDDPGEDHPPGIDNGNCPGQQFYNTLLVFFRNVGSIGCVFTDLRRTDTEFGSVDPGFIVRFTSYDTVTGTVTWEGQRTVRYRECVPSGGDCVACSPSDTTWFNGVLKVQVTADFTDATPIGWHVFAELWTEGAGGFYGDFFAGANPPLGDCSGVTGLPNLYTDGSGSEIAAGGTCDIFNATVPA